MPWLKATVITWKVRWKTLITVQSSYILLQIREFSIPGEQLNSWQVPPPVQHWVVMPASSVTSPTSMSSGRTQTLPGCSPSPVGPWSTRSVTRCRMSLERLALGSVYQVRTIRGMITCQCQTWETLVSIRYHLPSNEPAANMMQTCCHLLDTLSDFVSDCWHYWCH